VELLLSWLTRCLLCLWKTWEFIVGTALLIYLNKWCTDHEAVLHVTKYVIVNLLGESCVHISNHTDRLVSITCNDVTCEQALWYYTSSTFSCLIQCRTNHGYTGEYRRRFLPQEDPSCPCSKEFQSREHIIVHCTLHEHTRRRLRKVSRDIWLPTILGTKQGITALTAFLIETTAFTRNGQHPKKPPLLSFYDEPDDVEDPEP
jgi:hypothetical protein